MASHAELLQRYVAHGDESGTPKDGTLYQKIGDRWHYVITEAAVDRYIADSSQRSASVR